MNYNAGRYSTTFANEGGKEIWDFLADPENLIRMETATYLSRPAIEPLSPLLHERFGNRAKRGRNQANDGSHGQANNGEQRICSPTGQCEDK